MSLPQGDFVTSQAKAGFFIRSCVERDAFSGSHTPVVLVITHRLLGASMGSDTGYAEKGQTAACKDPTVSLGPTAWEKL